MSTCKKVCKVCGGEFVPDRGCTLEKRCPSCRFLYGASGERVKTVRRDNMLTSEELFWTYYSDSEKQKLSQWMVVEFSQIEDHESDISTDDCFQDEVYNEFRSNINKSVLPKLTERERFVIIHAFGLFGEEEMGQKEISEAIGVSRVRVQQIWNSVIRKLKKPSMRRDIERIVK